MITPRGGVGHLLVGQPEIAERLMRGLGLKGALPQYIDADFDTSITVEDLTQPEFDFLRRYNRYHGGFTITAVAAQYGWWGFGRNGTGEDALAVIQRLVLTNIAATTNAFYLGFLSSATAPGPGALASMPADERVSPPITPIPYFTMGGGQNATDFHTSAMIPLQVPGTATMVIEGPWIMTNAGQASGNNKVSLWIQNSVVNAPFAVGVFWKERPLLAAERSK